jgi:hypothetical protein
MGQYHQDLVLAGPTVSPARADAPLAVRRKLIREINYRRSVSRLPPE